MSRLARLGELIVELVEMRDQLVQALVRILTSLVCREQLGIERSDSSLAFFDVASKRRVLGDEIPVRIGQGRNRSLQPIEIGDFRSCVGNEPTPRRGSIVPRTGRTRQAVGEERPRLWLSSNRELESNRVAFR